MRLLSCLLLACSLCCGSLTYAGPAQLAIIIDDMGYELELGEQAIALSGDITFSFIAYTDHCQLLAEQAHRAGKELMLHIPMSNRSGHPLDKGALTDTMNKTEFLNTLDQQLKHIPHIRGVNNHMGSLLTEQAEPMNWLMQTLKQHDLYFVDSRTTANSVALQSAIDHGVAAMRRHIFIDYQDDPEVIREQLTELLAYTKQHSKAIAIAHPRAHTLPLLKDFIAELPQHDIELVPVSMLLSQPLPALARQPQVTEWSE